MQRTLEPTDLRMRLAGLLPLIFFAAHTLYYVKYGGVGHMLWMCNSGNLVLALGMIFRMPTLVRIAVIWLIPGLPLWLGFVALAGHFIPTSLFSHVGGLAVGLYAMSAVRSHNLAWMIAFVWYIVFQHLCRLILPEDLNVNLAHDILAGMEESFASYAEFWLVTTVLVGMGLWLINLSLDIVFPKRDPNQTS